MRAVEKRAVEKRAVGKESVRKMRAVENKSGGK
jgi:hypothetical protein